MNESGTDMHEKAQTGKKSPAKVPQDPGGRSPAVPAPREIGRANRAAVRMFMLTHLGCSRVEIGVALGLSAYAVGRHVAAIRREWGGA